MSGTSNYDTDVIYHDVDLKKEPIYNNDVKLSNSSSDSSDSDSEDSDSTSEDNVEMQIYN
jgi:hypothetical protein